jgi:hypothetical protein
MIKSRAALFALVAFALSVAAAYAGPTAKEGVPAGTPSSIAAAEEKLADVLPETFAVAQDINGARGRSCLPCVRGRSDDQTALHEHLSCTLSRLSSSKPVAIVGVSGHLPRLHPI